MKYKKNEFITAAILFVIGEDAEPLGEMPKSEAILLAQEAGLDLVEIAPTAKPPVARIISWSKFKYEQEKKKKKNTKNKAQEQKEIWFKPFISDGDIQHKLKKVNEFIAEKHNVKLTIKQRGRRVHSEVLQDLMRRLLELTAETTIVVTPPKLMGPNFSVIVGPLKAAAKIVAEKAPTAAPKLATPAAKK